MTLSWVLDAIEATSSADELLIAVSVVLLSLWILWGYWHLLAYDPIPYVQLPILVEDDDCE